MSQISKRNRNAAKLAFAGVGMITLPLFTLTDASADAVNGSTVIYGNSNAGGSTKITNNADVPDAGAVTTLNSSIRNLQAESNGIIHISPVPTTITKAELAATQAKVNQLVQLVQTYNQNKAQLNAQDNTMESFTGKKAVDTYTKIDGSNLDNALSQMQSINSQMSGMINDNQSTVNKTAQDSATRTTLDDAVKSANQQITNASGSIKEAQDGIYGNMDDVKRKSYDSSQQDGVKVDNTQTQQVNTVKTNVQPVQYTKVSSVSDINNALNNILNNVKNQTVDINNQTKAAGDYKDNALHNIDDVNQWLQNERRVGEQAESDIHTRATNAYNAIVQQQNDSIAALQQIYHTLEQQPNKLPKYIMDKVQQRIDEAVKIVNTSKVQYQKLANLAMADPVNFGNIGTRQDVQNGSTNGTIQNTKDTQANDFQNQIASFLETQATNIKASNDSANAITANNQDQINKFLKVMSQGNAFPKSFVQKMDIYKQSPGYQKYINEALNIDLDSNTVNNVAVKLGDKSKNVVTVPSNTTVAEAAAGLFKKYQTNIGKGFGSVMFKTSNLNDMDLKVKASDDILLDSRNAGGTMGVYNFFMNHTLGNSSGGWDDSPAVASLKSIANATNGDGSVSFVTRSNSLQLTIPDAFVTMDASGKVTTKDLKVTATCLTYNGESIAKTIDDQIGKKYGSGAHPTFIYTFYINEHTGQLIVQTGYVIAQGKAIGNNAGGPTGSGGTGEINMNLNSTTNVTGEIVINNSSDNHSSVTDQYAKYPKGLVIGSEPGGVAYGIGQLFTKGNTDVAKYNEGLAQVVRFNVDGGANDPFVKNAPIYVSDIDDGQQLIVPSRQDGDITKVITSNGNDGDTAHGFKKPDSWGGKLTSFSAAGKANQDSANVTDTKINKFSALVANMGTGFNGSRVVLRSKTNSGNYAEISTSFFAPFGVLPAYPDPPKMDVKSFNASINTTDVTRPTAVAHTEGNYTINAQPMYIQSDTHVDGDVKNMSAYLDLPTYNGVKPTTMTTASNDSFVVRQNKPTTRVTGAGNSLVIRYTNTPRLTASGNSLVIRNAQRQGVSGNGSLVVTGYTSSANTNGNASPLVTSLSGTSLVTVDANGNLVMNSLDNAMSTNPIADKITNTAPVVTGNADGTHTVSMNVYVDPSIQSVAQQALNDWKSALATKGVNLIANMTTNVSDLKGGVALAILNSVNTDVRVDSQSGQDDLRGVGGITVKKVYANLNSDNGQAVFNADGTITAGDALKNAGTVIQLNNQGINQYSQTMFRNNMNVSILKHEIGHSFGLQHVQGDSLMTPGAGNSTFTGVISDADATLAARNLTNPAYMNVSQTTIVNKKLNLTDVDPSTGEVEG